MLGHWEKTKNIKNSIQKLQKKTAFHSSNSYVWAIKIPCNASTACRTRKTGKKWICMKNKMADKYLCSMSERRFGLEAIKSARDQALTDILSFSIYLRRGQDTYKVITNYFIWIILCASLSSDIWRICWASRNGSPRQPSICQRRLFDFLFIYFFFVRIKYSFVLQMCLDSRLRRISMVFV